MMIEGPNTEVAVADSRRTMRCPEYAKKRNQKVPTNSPVAATRSLCAGLRCPFDRRKYGLCVIAA